MGIFYEQTEVVNRTSRVLAVRFDGQDTELQPNYTAEGKLIPEVHNLIPTITVPYAKSQNVLMGSEDPLDPTDYEVLIGVLTKPGQKQRDDISFCEQSSEMTRVKLEDYLDDPSLKIELAGRRVRPAEARSNKDTTPFEVRAR